MGCAAHLAFGYCGGGVPEYLSVVTVLGDSVRKQRAVLTKNNVGIRRTDNKILESSKKDTQFFSTTQVI